MLDWINPLYAYLGLGGAAIAALIAVAIYFPPFRKIALAVAAAIAGVLIAYNKGSRDRAALEEKRKEAAVAKARKNYADIDARPDTPDDVADKLRKHRF